MLGADGGIFSFGDAGFYGSAVNKPHRAPFLAMAATPASRGYYLLGADGGVFTFGNARFAGSAVDGHLATGISVLAQRRLQDRPHRRQCPWLRRRAVGCRAG